MNAKGKKVIAVDLDGTLAHYDGWRGPDHIGAPVTRMVERVRGWLAEGHTVVVFTARLSTQGIAVADIIIPIQRWCFVNVGLALPVTNTKTMDMDEFWDDRAVTVVQNKGEIFPEAWNIKVAGVSGTGPAAALRAAATLYEQRNGVYKDNWKKAGACLNALFPDGMPPDQEILHLLSLAIVKISRFVNSDLKNEDSLDDLAVYAALMADIVKQRKQQTKENK